MKLNPKYVIRTLLDEVVIVPTGDAMENFNGMISANDVGGFILQNIENAETPGDMIKLVLEEFDVDEETATKDVNGFLANLEAIGMIAF